MIDTLYCDNCDDSGAPRGCDADEISQTQKEKSHQISLVCAIYGVLHSPECVWSMFHVSLREKNVYFAVG